VDAGGEVRDPLLEIRVDAVAELVEREIDVVDARREARGVEVAEQLGVEAGVEVRLPVMNEPRDFDIFSPFTVR